MSSDAKQKTWSDGWGGVILVVIFFYVGRAAWYSEFRYSAQYGVPYSQITKANEPHDCEWLKAPIGDKECHFEARVTKVLSARDTNGKPIMSYDEGATWVPVGDTDRPIYLESPASTPQVASLTITWQKIED